MAWFTPLTNHLLSGVILQVGMYVLLLTLQEETYPTKREKKHPLLKSALGDLGSVCTIYTTWKGSMASHSH